MVNLEFNRQNFPVGTRFIWKNFYGDLFDGKVYEWSPTGDHVNVNGEWYYISTSLKPINVIELLDKEQM